jgi:pimeloyl-ACP methyl ester carboxylesterase
MRTIKIEELTQPSLGSFSLRMRTEERDVRKFLKPEPYKLLILVKGSDSHGAWCVNVEQAARDEGWGVDVRRIHYDPPPAQWVALWPFQFRRNWTIRASLDELMQLAYDKDAEVVIVAHSYGTYALVKYLLRRRANLGIHIKAVFLINGIAKRKHLTRIRSLCQHLINDVAISDRVPAQAAGFATPLVPFWNPYDDIGASGATTGTAEEPIIDRFFEGDHGTLVQLANFVENIGRFVRGHVQDPPSGKGEGLKHSTRQVFFMRIARNVVGVVAMTGAFFLCRYAVS